MRRIKRIVLRIKYTKSNDVIGGIIFVFLFPISFFLNLFYKTIGKKIWVISENDDCMTACDNGYNFFEYLYANNVKNIYFVINKKSPYYDKVMKYKSNVIKKGSLKHWIYYLCADKRISTHTISAPSMGIFYLFLRLGILKKNSVFLQHGVTYNDIPELYYENSRIGLFICGAKPEYDYVRNHFHYPESIVKYTGFARYDKLHNVKIKKNQIAIIPTWRRWIAMDLKNDSDFINTDYYKAYQGLLNDTKLIKYLESNNLNLIFLLHQSMDKYTSYFRSNSKNIVIADRKVYDIQALLRESALLITDYSSLFFDFAYMRKPIIYFQFDVERFREGQYSEGYFHYEKNGFGPVCNDKDSVITRIVEISDNSMIMADNYRKNVENFFVLNDNNNCKRIYEEITRMGIHNEGLKSERNTSE